MATWRLGTLRGTISSAAVSNSGRLAITADGLKPYCRRRAGRQRPRIDLDHAIGDSHPIGGELLGERRRRATVIEMILVAMPRAGDAAVDDAALADRTVLMRA